MAFTSLTTSQTKFLESHLRGTGKGYIRRAESACTYV